MADGTIPGAEKKLVAGILAIFLGGLGIHKFYLGYTQEGAIQLVLGFLCNISCFCLPGVLASLIWIVGIIEGVLYLTKSDQEFVDTYINGRKGWF